MHIDKTNYKNLFFLLHLKVFYIYYNLKFFKNKIKKFNYNYYYEVIYYSKNLIKYLIS